MTFKAVGEITGAIVDDMIVARQRDDAFAAALESLEIKSADNPDAARWIINMARDGRYADGNLRPAFLGSYIRMTEQEWDALWALIYG